MPVRNEGRHIGQSLGAVLAQDYPSACLEVLVTDGMSSDDTRAQVAALALRAEARVVIVDNPLHIAAAGLNRAVAQAKGEVILRVDGHCVISPDHVRRAVQALGDSTIGCVGGPIETIGEGYVSGAISAVMGSPFGVGGSAFRTLADSQGEARDADTVPFPAFPRSVIEHAGPFDEQLVRNQDDEYSYRLRALGYRVMLVPGLRSRYYARTSLIRLFRQYFQYGYFKVRILQLHPRQMKARHFVPPAFVAALGAGVLLLPVALMPLLGLLLAWAAAALAASAAAASRSGWRYLPLLPIAFLALHLGYGSGFLLGLVRFGGRWRRARGRSRSRAAAERDRLSVTESSS